ncbi:uncharacterized protein LTR77_010400 [Saxophila tyrrhenica]|uniref:Thioesterase domain-containing protein n=1 Tax=Saxophila tyrrhenica TaxID=1690608 RepID=A0AAV9NV95_9PEZI|nr:hypothetical protein LTR77_010400 [Saxophila tyrrhenica]
MAPENSFREMTATFEQLSPEERIRTILRIGEPGKKRLTAAFIEEQCKLKSFEKLSDTEAKATYTFKVEHFYTNGSGNLQGGAQSMIFDICTSLTLQAISTPGRFLNGGVSRVLTVNYLRPAPEGSELELETEVISVGKTLAMTRGTLRRASDGAAISTCEHNKAAVPTKPQWKL